MTDDSVRTRTRENASGIAAVLVTGTWLALLMLDIELWLAVMLFGYIAVVPVVSMLFDEEEETESDRAPASEPQRDTESADDALQRLRRRYADGELTDEQFERKLERLLETETVEDVEQHVDAVRRGSDTARDSRAAERLSDRETE